MTYLNDLYINIFLNNPKNIIIVILIGKKK